MTNFTICDELCRRRALPSLRRVCGFAPQFAAEIKTGIMAPAIGRVQGPIRVWLQFWRGRVRDSVLPSGVGPGTAELTGEGAADGLVPPVILVKVFRLGYRW